VENVATQEEFAGLKEVEQKVKVHHLDRSVQKTITKPLVD